MAPRSRCVRSRVFASIAAALLAGASAAPGSAADRERDTLLDRIDRSRTALFAELEGLTPEQAAWKPAPDRWSVAECMEHIVLAEGAITGVLETLAPPAVGGEEGERVTDDWLMSFATDRSKTFEAPGAIQPAGRFATLDEARAAFDQGRTRVRGLIAEAGDDLRARGAYHPALERYLDGLQWALLVTGHVERHTLQIREVKASAGFPSR
jgi:hypothetical protein